MSPRSRSGSIQNRKSGLSCARIGQCCVWAALLLIGFVNETAVVAEEGTSTSALLSADAALLRRELAEKILPYWHDTAIDKTNGGYLLADDLNGRGMAHDKCLVTQSRMVWGFSLAHLRKLESGQRDYLAAARQGYEFLVTHFLDRTNGGYYWSTDLPGRVTDSHKSLYAEAFVIYAFVEYSRASGDSAPLQKACDLFHVIQKRGHDGVHKGWIEHFTADWKPSLDTKTKSAVEVPGLRSSNAHLHWMEALTELCDATHDTEVKAALVEALELNQHYFYPLDASKSAYHFHPDWTRATGPRSDGLSYGHNVEFAWLMIRAEKVLGREPSWPHFYADIDHALAHGFDHERGGLYSTGKDNEPASNMDKSWWVQAEIVAALTDAILHNDKESYKMALHQTLQFVRKHQTDPKDGVWIELVSAEGRPRSTSKANEWKANYHDVRAIIKFTEAFP